MGDATTQLTVVGDDYNAELADIQANIDATRRRIESNLKGLEEEVSRRVDVKGWIQANPGKAVGLAFALGLYVGLK